jgi:hypothetical protein
MFIFSATTAVVHLYHQREVVYINIKWRTCPVRSIPTVYSSFIVDKSVLVL